MRFLFRAVCLTIAAGLFLPLWVGPLWAQEKAVQEAPLEVTSDRLEADDRARTVIFLGEVMAKQADLVIYAQKMTIYYQEKDRTIEKIVAEGDVRIVQGARVATGQLADYDRSKGEIVLTGEPQVHQGSDVVRGEKIVVLLNEDRSVISGQGNTRVNAVFHPRSEKP